MRRTLSGALALAAGAWALTGCAGAIIHNVTAQQPSKCGKLLVDCEVIGLYPQPCEVVATWAGYEAKAPVPLQGTAETEFVTVELTDWVYKGNGALNRLDVSFERKGRPIARKRYPPLFDSPDVLDDPCPDDTSAASQKEPATAPANGGGAAAPAPAPATARQPSGWPTPEQYSASLDAPTRKPLTDEIVCELDASSGPRYVALEHTPNGVVRLTIDVASKGEARFREVTFWSIELLDEEGQPLPLAEEGRVDLGGHRRVSAEWRFDGSPVVLKLQSFSQEGDFLRIRFD